MNHHNNHLVRTISSAYPKLLFFFDTSINSFQNIFPTTKNQLVVKIIHVIQLLVEQIVNVASFTSTQSVPARLVLLVAHLIVDQSALSAQNVHKTELVSIKSASILVHPLAVKMLVVKSLITTQYVLVHPDIPVIRLNNVYVNVSA